VGLPSVPLELKDSRFILKDARRVPQVMIQWDLMDATEATWEDLAEIQEAYPWSTLRTRLIFIGRVMSHATHERK
jgi:hypothetical protein